MARRKRHMLEIYDENHILLKGIVEHVKKEGASGRNAKITETANAFLRASIDAFLKTLANKETSE